MSRADVFIALLDDPSAEAPQVGERADEALLGILVHLACADGVVQEEEFAFLERVLPGRETTEILGWVADTASEAPNLEQLADLLDGREERLGALRFAVRLAWADHVLDPSESSLLAKLTATFGLSPEDLEAALQEVVARPGAIQPAKRDRSEPQVSDQLAVLAPEGAAPLTWMRISCSEVAIYDLGIAAIFEEGPMFLRWEEIDYYTRVPLFGAAMRVVAIDGRVFTVQDARLGELGSVLDNIFGL